MSKQSNAFGGARPKTSHSNLKFEKNKKSPSPNSIANSESEPLEKKELYIDESGFKFKRKALHPDWVEQRTFIHCSSPPFDDKNSAELEHWTEQVDLLCSDLDWLLNLPHHKFWSQIIYDSKVVSCIETFLSCRPRWFEKMEFNEIVCDIVHRIDKLVFLIFLRMSTHKESKDYYITPSAFGELIYNHYLFDSCKFLDLCVLYGQSNKEILKKMFTNIFTNQPKYNNDMEQLVSALTLALSNVEAELSIIIDPEEEVNILELIEIVQFASDNVFSVLSFMEIFPDIIRIFHQKDYIGRLSTFYEQAIPVIGKEISRFSNETTYPLKDPVEPYFYLRRAILSVFRKIIYHICVYPIENKKDNDTLENCISSYVHIITSCGEEKLFITDYNTLYGFDDDIKVYKKNGTDTMSLQFLKDSINQTVGEVMSMYKDQELKPVAAVSPVKQENRKDTSGMNGYYDSQENKYNADEIASFVSSIQDLFPNLESDYIKQCLRHYNYSTEDLISAVLEDRMPSITDSHKKQDKNTPNSQDKTNECDKTQEDSNSLLSERKNIYDGDDFDTFSNPNTSKKVHKGKMSNSEFGLDDEFKKRLKDIAQQYDENSGYSIYEDELKYSPMLADVYEDEHDDMYELHDVGVMDINTENKTVNVPSRWFGRGALNVKGLNLETSESPEEEVMEAEVEKKSNARIRQKPRNNNEIDVNAEVEKMNYDQRNEAENGQNNRGKRNGRRRRGKPQPNSQGDEERDQTNSNATQQFSKEDDQKEYQQPKSNFVQFCENPEDARRRAEERRLSKMGQNSWRNKREIVPNHNQNQEESRPRYVTKNSGKAWRQQPNSQGGYKGGKVKEEDDKKNNVYRNKTIHKNEHKRQGQSSYRS